MVLFSPAKGVVVRPIPIVLPDRKIFAPKGTWFSNRMVINVADDKGVL